RDEFEGRVIWIEAESKESIGRSFRRLAAKLQIQLPVHVEIPELVENIYRWFEGKKCLFVFDNAEEMDYIKEFLPIGCHKKPFMLMTSRNRDILALVG